MRLGATDNWKARYRLLTWSQVAAAGLLSLTAVASQYQIAPGDPSIWHDLVYGFKSQANYIVVLANIVLWSSHSVKKYIGHPWAWDTVKSLLEDLRSDVFHGQLNIDSHLDRVTLFQKKNCRWRFGIFPVSDWLVTVERAGHMTRKRRKWFRVKDDGQVFEGVAGATWRSGRTMLVECLPELTDCPPSNVIKAYAKKSFITEAYVRQKLLKGTPFPRSLCGIMVEVNSKPWGVIVIDSQFEKLVTQAQVEEFYRKNARSLAKLLAVL